MSNQIIVTETQKPPLNDFINEYARGKDPWHAEAFKGTPMEGHYENIEPRKTGWYALDWCGNVIGFVADGTVYENV